MFLYFAPIYLNEQLHFVLTFIQRVFFQNVLETAFFCCSKCVTNLNIMLKLDFSVTKMDLEPLL